MSDPIDFHLKLALKRWTAAERPPKNARARLLLQAAAPYYPSEGTGDQQVAEAPGFPAIYLGSPHHDLSAMLDLLWATRLPLSSMQVQT